MTAGRRPSALRCCRDLGAGSRHRSISSAKLSAPPSRALKGATAAFREIDRPQRVGHGPTLRHDERRLDDRHRPFMSDGEPRAIEPPLARLVSMPADPAQPFAPLQSGHSDTPLAGSVLDWSAAEEDAYTLKQRSADASSSWFRPAVLIRSQHALRMLSAGLALSRCHKGSRPQQNLASC